MFLQGRKRFARTTSLPQKRLGTQGCSCTCASKDAVDAPGALPPTDKAAPPCWDWDPAGSLHGGMRKHFTQTQPHAVLHMRLQPTPAVPAGRHASPASCSPSAFASQSPCVT